MTEQKEPSMEDILASIRNILSDDDESNQAVSAPVKVEEKVETYQLPKESPVADTYVPESIEKIADTYVPELEQQADMKNSNMPVVEETMDKPFVIAEQDNVDVLSMTEVDVKEEILDLTTDMIISDNNLDEDVFPVENFDDEDDGDVFIPEPVIVQDPVEDTYEPDVDSLLAEPTVVAAAESFSQLRSFAQDNSRLSLGRGDLTIETIVRETLKPYLKEWLDMHLPEIVERVVKKEVAHIMDRLDLK